jgi:tight adherence protein C
MTSLTLIAGMACLAGAIVTLVLLVSARPAEAGEPATPADGGVPRAPVPVANTELAPLLERFRSIAARLSPRDYGKGLQRRLDLAGNPPAWPASRVLAFKGVGLVAGALLGGLVGLHHGVLLALLALFGGAIGYFLPDILIRNAGEKRQARLRKGLPDALDMLTVCVEAGLGFDSALARVARQLDGPIAAECARVLQEMQIGKSRSEALRAMADRSAVPELRTFVSALVQSAELGISVGNVLREQAKEMRLKRRQWAEERAQKLPVKIIFPLIMCLLPAMFVVVLGPVAINIFHTLGNLNR